MKRPILIATFVCALSWVGSRALAAPTAPSAPPPAAPAPPDMVAVMKEANRLFDLGRYAEAIPLYETVLQTLGSKGFKVHFNLGLAYEKTGDITSAVEHYTAFIDASDKDPFSTAEVLARVRDANDSLASLKERYGAIRVTTTRTDPVFYRIAGGPPRAAGTTFWVAPGEHSVELDTGTARVRTVRVKVQAGQTIPVPVDAPPEQQTVVKPQPVVLLPPPPPPPEKKSGFPTTALVIGASATVVSFVAPLIFGLDASSQMKNAEAAGPFAGNYASLKSDYEDARTRYYVSYAVPATAAIVTAVVVLLSLPSASVSRERDSKR